VEDTKDDSGVCLGVFTEVSLIYDVVEKADASGHAAFLEASPAGAPVYRRYGFKEVYKFVVDLRGKNALIDEYEELFMLREPAKTT